MTNVHNLASAILNLAFDNTTSNRWKVMFPDFECDLIGISHLAYIELYKQVTFDNTAYEVSWRYILTPEQAGDSYIFNSSDLVKLKDKVVLSLDKDNRDGIFIEKKTDDGEIEFISFDEDYFYKIDQSVLSIYDTAQKLENLNTFNNALERLSNRFKQYIENLSY